jgi:hypothetical protein
MHTNNICKIFASSASQSERQGVITSLQDHAENIPTSDWYKMAESLLSTAKSERQKKRAAGTRLTQIAKDIRLFVESYAHLWDAKTIRTSMHECLELIAHEQGLYAPMALDLLKALNVLVEVRRDALHKADWQRILHLGIAIFHDYADLHVKTQGGMHSLCHVMVCRCVSVCALVCVQYRTCT